MNRTLRIVIAALAVVTATTQLIRVIRSEDRA
jgi:hypothetical protein